jgi:dihydroflavonol-4-reductase
MILLHKIAYFRPSLNKHFHIVIAVSGASGFLGSYIVCMLLEKGKNVRAFKRASSSMSEFETIFNYYFRNLPLDQRNSYKQQLNWVLADVNDIPSLEVALEGIDEIYHCAAIVSFMQKDRDRLLKVNVEGTKNMVNISLVKGVKKFSYVSSIAALGRAKSGDLIDETSKWQTSKHNSNYAISKYKAEMEVWRGAEEGLNVTIVNPGVILGTGDWHKGSTKLFSLVWKGMPFYTEGVNGYVDVQDVARAMIELTERSILKERFILVAENLNMKWYLDTVAECFGKKKPTIKVNRLLAQLAWMVDGLKGLLTGKDPSLTRETANASMNTFYYSSKKIETRIGFTFTPMKQTIIETCTQFLISHQL